MLLPIDDHRTSTNLSEPTTTSTTGPPQSFLSFPGSPSHVRPPRISVLHLKRPFDLMKRRRQLTKKGGASIVPMISGRPRSCFFNNEMRMFVCLRGGWRCWWCCRRLFLVSMVALHLLLFFMGTATGLVVPGDVAWLGGTTEELPQQQQQDDGTPDDYARFLPLPYVLLGAGGMAVVRVLTTLEEDCPSMILLSNVTNNSTTDSKSFEGIRVPRVQLRAVGDWTLPYAFPLRVCDARLTGSLQKAAWNAGALRLDHPKLVSRPPVLIPQNPQRYLWLSDTGLRSRPYDLGLGNACEALLNDPTTTAPLLYGVAQCPLNVTQRDLDLSKIVTDAQSLEDWLLTTLMKRAAEQTPDVVVFAGGALYRQGPCPALVGGSNDAANCTGINGGGYTTRNITASDLFTYLNGTDGTPSVVTNFWPGRWGDNWFGWWSDFFFPAKSLLKVAPWIVAPGDEEASACAGAASRGYYLLLSTDPYPRKTRAGEACQPSIPPFAVPFANEQIVVQDSSRSSVTKAAGTSNDSESCPDEPDANATKLLATSSASSEEGGAPPSDADVARLAEYWRAIEQLTASHATNILVSHRPVFGVQCSRSHWITTDDALQAALQNGTMIHDGTSSALDRVSVVVSGHNHALQALEFADNALPPQVTVGHGGTKLDPDEENALSIVWSNLALQLSGGASTFPVERGIETSAMHGFALLDRTPSGSSYEVTLLSYDPVADALVKLDFPLSFPSGPRVIRAPSAAPSSSRAPSNAPIASPTGRSGGGPQSPSQPSPPSDPSDNGLSNTSGSRVGTGVQRTHLIAGALAALTVIMHGFLI